MRQHAWSGLVLPVSGGRVACPRRGVTDLGRCLSCPAYGGFQDGPVERLVCMAEAAADFSAADFSSAEGTGGIDEEDPRRIQRR